MIIILQHLKSVKLQCQNLQVFDIFDLIDLTELFPRSQGIPPGPIYGIFSCIRDTSQNRAVNTPYLPCLFPPPTKLDYDKVSAIVII